jgi:hypothetical protein
MFNIGYRINWDNNSYDITSLDELWNHLRDIDDGLKGDEYLTIVFDTEIPKDSPWLLVRILEVSAVVDRTIGIGEKKVERV